jgi:uncharacterized protein (TIGR02145 family)
MKAKEQDLKRLGKIQLKNLKLFTITLFCIELTGLKAQTVKDIDGNVYNIVTIGKQVWMAENLKTTKYLNRDSIGTTSPVTLDITTENTPKYQWVYDGNESNVTTYGRLYTWYTIIDRRKICPKGWHIPTDVEWTILTDNLTNNGYGYNGGANEIAKSMADTSVWTIYSIAGTVGNDQTGNNRSGFPAVPGGYRYGSGSFNGFGEYSYWWSATEVNATTAFYRSMNNHSSDVYRNNSSKQNAVSVRCLRNK